MAPEKSGPVGRLVIEKQFLFSMKKIHSFVGRFWENVCGQDTTAELAHEKPSGGKRDQSPFPHVELRYRSYRFFAKKKVDIKNKINCLPLPRPCSHRSN